MFRKALLGDRIEIVLVDAGQADDPVVSHCDTALDHQTSQARTVDQHNALGDLLAVLSGLAGERGRRDEDALSSTPAGERAEERLDFRSPDRPLPSLGLDVDFLKAQAVQIDHTVDATVAYSPKPLGVFRPGAVTKLLQQFQHQLLEEGWRSLQDPFKKVIRDSLFDLAHCIVDALFRGLRRRWPPRIIGALRRRR
ncbi:MAG TPA: hypothetical protein VGD07_11560 [Methylomirabilota bacterium]